MNNLRDTTGGIDGAAHRGASSSRTRRELEMTEQAARYLEFRVELLGIRPAIWRRIRVPFQSTFWDLHVAIQDSMGWTDSHLHCFRVVDPETREELEFGIPDDDDEGEILPGWSEFVCEFVDLGSRPIALYEYDFGDGWLHALILEDMGEADPGSLPACLDGSRRCPPEDVGGIPGYEDFVEAMADPAHPQHEELSEWIGEAFDPEDFDPARVRFRDPREWWNEVFEADDEDDEF